MGTVRTRITVDDLRREENHWREVVDGEWVDAVSPTYSHAWIARNIFRLLDAYVIAHQLGEVMPDGVHYNLDLSSPGLENSRLPDVSFVRKDRVPQDFDQVFPGAPDLAVEVISDSERSGEIMRKIDDYLRFGTEEVWVVYPQPQALHRYSRQNPRNIRVYRAEDVLDGETLLPGFQVVIGQLFSQPEQN